MLYFKLSVEKLCNMLLTACYVIQVTLPESQAILHVQLSAFAQFVDMPILPQSDFVIAVPGVQQP